MLHHLCPEQQNVKPLVKWKDLLPSQWKGPDPLLTGGQGCACIFLQDADLPIWIPDRVIHHVAVPQAPGSSTAKTTKKKKKGPSSAPASTCLHLRTEQPHTGSHGWGQPSSWDPVCHAHSRWPHQRPSALVWPSLGLRPV